MLLHIYCTEVLVVKLYYSTYISQLWSGDSNQISEKAIKGLNYEALLNYGVIFLLLLTKAASQGLGLGLLPWPARGVEIHLHTSHSILLLPVLYRKRRNRAASPVNDWEGDSQSHLEGCVVVYFYD